MKVQNMISERSERNVPNQFVMWDDNGNVYFQSYNSLIAKWDGERLLLGRDFDYSVTTVKYLHQWIVKFVGYRFNCEVLEYKKSSYAGKLQAMIDDGKIDYDYNMR